MTENTLRDQFAMAALTGVMASVTGDNQASDLAAFCYAMADEMILAREKPKANEGAEK